MSRKAAVGWTSSGSRFSLESTLPRTASASCGDGDRTPGTRPRGAAAKAPSRSPRTSAICSTPQHEKIGQPGTASGTVTPVVDEVTSNPKWLQEGGTYPGIRLGSRVPTFLPQPAFVLEVTEGTMIYEHSGGGRRRDDPRDKASQPGSASSGGNARAVPLRLRTSPGSMWSSGSALGSFYHYTLGGLLQVKREVLEREVEEVICRWCNSAAHVQEVGAEP